MTVWLSIQYSNLELYPLKCLSVVLALSTRSWSKATLRCQVDGYGRYRFQRSAQLKEAKKGQLGQWQHQSIGEACCWTSKGWKRPKTKRMHQGLRFQSCLFCCSLMWYTHFVSRVGPFNQVTDSINWPAFRVSAKHLIMWSAEAELRNLKFSSFLWLPICECILLSCHLC